MLQMKQEAMPIDGIACTFESPKPKRHIPQDS
jgi:hypothetical protein